ncbi:hypothetical protein EZV73_22495 [Acidaminobacter sp. JC074]|uniref:hypothetical protein n=1 Tax=Acidaminobacter sp. JC074 TaxID=2530199 RepID=UPI001F0DA6E7|nr:hypothetical protein [Acidaminobacter sp. JC074]MCH4890370.1 hypothetical protein [Acidaminobacter sp. JC074]
MTINLDKYDIIDTFDDNQFQTVLMGIDTLTMVDIVIINKLKSSIDLDDDFFRLYQDICDNLISLERGQDETVIINKYKQSQLLNDYLHEEDLSFESRVLLAKSFLLQAVNYQEFTNAIKIILINEDQLTVRNNQLHFSNYLFLKKYHNHVTNGDVLKSMGKTLETILQLYKEPLTGQTKPYQSLIYKLMNTDLDYDIRQLYQKFDAVSKGQEEVEEVKEKINVEEIVSLTKEDIKLVEDTEAIIIKEDTIETITLENTQEVDDSILEVDEILPQITDEDIIEEVTESITEVEKDFVDEVEEVFSDELSEKNFEDITDETSEDKSIDTADKVFENKSQNTFEDVEAKEILDDLTKTDHEIETEIIENHDKSDDEAKVVTDSLVKDDVLDEKTPLFQKEQVIQTEKMMPDATEPLNQEAPASKENKHHRIVLENKAKGDSIQEILDRNDRLHNTLSETSKKKRYFPTFLLFFIVLTIITVLLILYSSTYA